LWLGPMLWWNSNGSSQNQGKPPRELQHSSRELQNVLGMSNYQLAHEVLLNPLFQLDENENDTDDKLVLTNIRQTIKPEFWRILFSNLAHTPQSNVLVLNVLKEIKTSIQNVVQNHPESLRMIPEIIDLDLISQTLGEGTILNVMECNGLLTAVVEVIVSIHQKLQTPLGRKQETEQKWQEVSTRLRACYAQDQAVQARCVCEALKLVMDRLYLVQVDAANLKLRNIVYVYVYVYVHVYVYW
jgi:hypothetical protein